MQQVIKKSLWVCALVLSLQSAWAFTGLSKPASWQTPPLGYNPLPPDALPTGPAAAGEEYRRTTPMIYYAYDANFASYFGSNGEAAVEQAIGIMNSVSNVDSYSTSLSEFPLNSKLLNPTAGALNLTDLKSTALSQLVEQMGLAAPTRYVWTLESRFVPANAVCPNGVEYLIVQRNYDTTSSPLGLIQPSSYINGEFYENAIYEFCAAGGNFPNGPVLATTIPFPADPLALTFSSVASDEDVWYDVFPPGYFHTGLTRDDYAGYRYEYSTNNINFEDAAPGSLELTTNNAAPVTLTTSSLGDLIAQSKTNPPATLQANFPGLEIASSTNFFVVQVATNLTAYYTNAPGPSVTNYSPNFFTNTLDLGLLASQAATNNPAQLVALYPGLVIVTTNSYFTNIPTPNLVITTKPVNGQPAGTVKVVTTTNGFTPNVFQYWVYTFGNIYTNSYSPNSMVTILTTSIKISNGSPVGTLPVTNTLTTKILIHTPTGDGLIVPTNWCGFKITQRLYTNVLLSTSNSITSSNLVSGTNIFTGTQTTFTSYTNHGLVIEPGVCEPALFFSTNYTTNIVVQYRTTFANVVTNSYFSNSVVSIITTNIGACSNGVDGTLCTNITQQSVIQTNVPSGDFFIPEADWCGYTILSTLLTTPVHTTNTVITATIPAGVGDIGQQYSVTTVSTYTNHTFLIQPQTCATITPPAQQRQGIGGFQFVRVPDNNVDPLTHNFFVPVTNNYTMVLLTNNQLVTQYFQRILTTPDVLFDAQDLPGTPQTFTTLTRNINFNSTQALPGSDGPGTIDPTTTITFNSLAPIGSATSSGYTNVNQFLNPSGLTNYVSSTTNLIFAWASFGASTNDPVVYPDSASIQNLENQAVIQVSPSSLPDGTNGVVYNTVTFTVTGGQPPFTWSLPSGSSLPQGLSLSAAGVLSGTPSGNPSGTYDFIIQLNDSAARTVQLNYSINIQ